jgi:hypothetical protein
MQSLSAERAELMATDSASRSLETALSPRSEPRSLPAKSTKVNRPTAGPRDLPGLLLLLLLLLGLGLGLGLVLLVLGLAAALAPFDGGLVGYRVTR